MEGTRPAGRKPFKERSPVATGGAHGRLQPGRGESGADRHPPPGLDMTAGQWRSQGIAYSGDETI
jgi:hypothetical protein